MKKNAFILILFFMNYSVLFGSVNFQTSISEKAKSLVAEYFDKLYGNENNRYTNEDINYKFEIINVLTCQRIDEDLENGMLYYCSPYGDDKFGIYLLIENACARLMEINNPLQVELVRSFFKRNRYSSDEIDTFFKHITTIYLNEEMYRNYEGLVKSEDYLRYQKEVN